MEILYYCPECNGENITQEIINSPKPQRVSMLDAPTNQFNIHTLVHMKQTHKLTCKDCGFSVEYTTA